MDNLQAKRAICGRFLNFDGGTLRSLLVLLAWAIVVSVVPAAFAQPAVVNRPESAPVGQLQSLLNQTITQFQIAYRHNEAEQTLRRKQLAAAVKAWRAAPRSEANNQRLAQWLRDAIRNSMPGSREALPPVPEFDIAPVPRQPLSPTTTRQKPVIATRSNHSGESMLAPAGDTFPATSEPQTGVPPAGGEDGSRSASDFWSEHPATGELPADLTGGDPFRDDP